MGYTESQKKQIYLYRERHPEKWREYMRLKAKKYYNEQAKEKKRLYYLKKKQERLDSLKIESLGIIEEKNE